MSDPHPAPAPEPALLLLAGACHGAWAWQAVLPHLPDARAIDLPRAADSTLADHAATIAAVLTGPTVLVAHSAAGFSASAAAAVSPDVAAIIFLCAWVPDGRSLAQIRRSAPERPLQGCLRPDGAFYGFAPETLVPTFYHDCPPDAVARALPRLHPEPRLPHETPLEPPTCPAAYLLCGADRALPPAFQRRMAAALPVTELPCGHSPFLACPAELATTLRAMARHLTGYPDA